MKRVIGYIIVSASLVVGGVWVAAQVNLTTFEPGGVISAAEVNANFEALRSALENGVTSLNGQQGAIMLAAGTNVSIDDGEDGTIVINAAATSGVDADDHYTKAEVDALIAEAKRATRPAYAWVLSDGGVHSSSNIVSVSRPNVGRYCVFVARTLAWKGSQATLTRPGLTNDQISLGTGHGSHCNALSTTEAVGVPVYITSAAGDYIDRDFSVFVPAR